MTDEDATDKDNKPFLVLTREGGGLPFEARGVQPRVTCASSVFMTRTFHTHSAAETRALAARLGALLQPGDTLCLAGDLGAGKTTFTQGLALGLGLPPEEPVNSPTFTLVSEHPGGRVPLYHFDVYRLPDSSGLYDLAFDEYLNGDGVVVIEWADKITDALPQDRLDLAFTADGPDTRHLVLTAQGTRAEELLTAL